MKKIILIIHFCIFCSILYSLDIAKEIPNTIVPFNNISIERLLLANRDDSSIEDFHYQQEIWKQENEYFDSLSTTIKDQDSIVGDWYLYDSNNRIIEKYKKATIHLTPLNNGVLYRCQSSTSYLYPQDDDTYLIMGTWDAGIIRLITIQDKKLYIYNLDGNTWYLDKIHDDGSYYKRK